MATPHEDLGSAAGTVTNTAREFADPAFNSTQSILDSLDAEAREDANEGESGADDDAQPQESQDGTGAKKVYVRRGVLVTRAQAVHDAQAKVAKKAKTEPICIKTGG